MRTIGSYAHFTDFLTLLLVTLTLSACVGTVAEPTPDPSPTPTITGPRQDKWLVLKCNFPEIPTLPHDDDFYKGLFAKDGIGHGGMVDYFQTISYGKLDLSLTEVRGWYPLSYSVADDAKLSRYERTQKCVEAAGSDIKISDYFSVVVIRNAIVDSGSGGGRVLMDADFQFPMTAAHEMLHVYGLMHSWDDSSRQAEPWSGPGEYFDSWDIMSVEKVYSFWKGEFGPRGPELNAPYRLKMGWLDQDRILELKRDAGARDVTVDLIALERSDVDGPLAIRLPFPGDTDPQHYYMIELRLRAGLWDEALPSDAVLIHEVKSNGLSYLQTRKGLNGQPDGARLAGDSFTNTSVMIDVVDILSGDSKARVRVRW
jgi:hypothetical protein